MGSEDNLLQTRVGVGVNAGSSLYARGALLVCAIMCGALSLGTAGDRRPERPFLFEIFSFFAISAHPHGHSALLYWTSLSEHRQLLPQKTYFSSCYTGNTAGCYQQVQVPVNGMAHHRFIHRPS